MEAILQSIYDIFAAVPDFFLNIYDFLNSGIVDFIVSMFDYIVDTAKCILLKIALLMLKFLWVIVKELLTTLNISSQISSAFNAFNGDIANMLIFFRIPEALNMILAAFVTRFVLRLIPFM